jgi:hypothetical protein
MKAIPPGIRAAARKVPSRNPATGDGASHKGDRRPKGRNRSNLPAKVYRQATANKARRFGKAQGGRDPNSGAVDATPKANYWQMDEVDMS